MVVQSGNQTRKKEESMNITQLEKEIIKAIDIERDILNKLDTHTTLDTLDYSFIDLKKFIIKLLPDPIDPVKPTTII